MVYFYKVEALDASTIEAHEWWSDPSKTPKYVNLVSLEKLEQGQVVSGNFFKLWIEQGSEDISFVTAIDNNYAALINYMTLARYGRAADIHGPTECDGYSEISHLDVYTYTVAHEFSITDSALGRI